LVVMMHDGVRKCDRIFGKWEIAAWN